MPIQVAMIAGGPGGYAAAFLAADLGLSVALIDPETNPGGVCVYRGCIPSKALLHVAKLIDESRHAKAWGVEFGEPSINLDRLREFKNNVVKRLTSGTGQLARHRKVNYMQGWAEIVDAHNLTVKLTAGGEEIVQFEHALLATGSLPAIPPMLKVDDPRVMDSTAALDLPDIPKSLLVVGGGYIGLELGMCYAKFGSKVTVVEALPRLLANMDKDCVAVVDRKLKKMGVEVMTETKAKSWEDKGDRAVLTVELKDGQGGTKTAAIDADKILLSVGRRPNSENLGLEQAGVAVTKGFIVADDKLRTSVPGIYAIGDVIGGMMLAHKATKDGEVVAEIIAGHNAAFDVRTIPAVVFTDPEVSSTGLTEDEAKAKGHTELKVGKFPFAALGRALSVNDTDGFVKVIADAKTGELLGVHIAGNGGSDLISEATLAIEMGAVADDLRLTIHPHPTLSEAMMEAAAASMGEAVHIMNR